MMCFGVQANKWQSSVKYVYVEALSPTKIMRYKIISRTSRLLSYIANGNKLMAFQKEAAFCDKRITRNTSKKKKTVPN